jgi:hypothetical protein
VKIFRRRNTEAAHRAVVGNGQSREPKAELGWEERCVPFALMVACRMEMSAELGYGSMK